MSKIKTEYLIACVSDLHVNSTVALCKPRVPLDDGGEYVSSKAQRWIWTMWLNYWAWVKKQQKRAKCPLIVWIGGECADDLNHKSTQLISRNPADQKRHAIDCLMPMLDLNPEQIIIMRGSEAHSGPSACLDEFVADDIGASGDKSTGTASWYHWIGEIGGVTIDGAHHAGHGHGRPWTKGGDANRLAADIIYRYVDMGLMPPDLVLRGHNHKAVDSFDNHSTRAIVLPSWQLTNAYGHRLGGGFSKSYLDIGGALISIDGGEYEVRKRYYKWPVKVADYWRPE